MTSSTFFVTGMQRSGTTLLEKLLSNHPQVSILSQPFPFLLLECKRSFLRRFGLENARFPLGNLFLEDAYSTEDFSAHLVEHTVGRRVLRELFAAMADFSGQYTRFDNSEVEAVLDRLIPGDLMTTLAQLYREFAHKTGAERFGGKETICEEFLPYLLARDCKCLVIVRDPRDILASLNCGRGPQYAGSLKPTLFNLRNWRKSVAFVLHLQRDPGFA